MLDPTGLYELSPGRLDLERPVLVQALSGFVDAGNGVRLAREALLQGFEHSPVATFDVDQLLDYRSRRPLMTFVRDHWDDYPEPEMLLHVARDSIGTPFLLLTGPEPDVQWERFVAAVIGLVTDLGVRLTIGLDAIPMAVPHTRPVGITAHGTDTNLLAGYEPWIDTVMVPASAGHLLEYRLGKASKAAMGLAVHVPHYVAQMDYPDAASALLAAVSRASGLALPAPALSDAGARTRVEIDEQVAASNEVAEVVRALETQYDAFVEGRTRTDLAAGSGIPLPSADELGAELERFLAEQTRPPEAPEA